MNQSSSTTRIIPATEVAEGAGVTVQRTIGTPALRNHDPFLMMDFFGSDNPDDYIAGFPSHPHRGFNTFTYMIDGYTEHKDSMGNTGSLGPGAAQWMKAGSGVIHSEMPRQENGLLRGFQLWINLPAANKMDTPAYQEYPSDAFPVIETEDYRLKVLIGNYADTHSPITDDITTVSYLDVALKAGKRFSHELERANNSMIFVFEGDGRFNGQPAPTNSLIAFGQDDIVFDIEAGEQGMRFILVSGRPINEPIVQYGPFVMNTREEIEEAMRDYQTNNLVRNRAVGAAAS